MASPDHLRYPLMTQIDVRVLRVDRAFVLGKCSSFVDFQLWPIRSMMDPEGWLHNFTSHEQEYAHHLLNSFLYYSEPLMRALFIAGFQNISSTRRHAARLYHPEQLAWREFCDNLIVTYVTGEIPNPTDSGFLFARMARQFLGIGEGRIVDPRDALRALSMGRQRPILFVDDFVGSGEQFISTWRRPYDIGAAGHLSFESYARSNSGDYYYCPLLCTSDGAQAIARSCPSVQVSPGNWLTPRYSALHPNSLVWPEHLRATGPTFVLTASQRAGIPDTDGGQNDWRGFHRLGLSIAFQHSVPDATLPLFYWTAAGPH